MIGLAIGVAGAGLLSLGSSDAGHESAAALIGDGLTLIAAFFFAAQVILLERLGRTIEPTYITVTFFLTCGVLSLTGALLGAGSDTGVRAWAVWIVRMFAEPHMPVKFAVLTVVCTVLAFGLMNAYQPRVPASRAALIYLLESVFSSLISVLAGFDRLTWLLLMGGGLILFGNLMVELPTILRGPRRLSGTTGLSLADEIHRP